MLTLTHAFVSGAVGERMPDPVSAFLVGILVHLIIDKVPHFWPKSEKSQNLIKVVDTALTFVALVALYTAGLKNTPELFFGALGGVLVDAVIVLTPLEKKKIGLWHTNRQIHVNRLAYYAADFIFIALSIILIWKYQ